MDHEPCDSESSAEDSVASQKSPGDDEERAGPISLSTTESLNELFTGETIDYRLPCTATEDTTCHIVGHLSAWNELLCPVSWQLREMPGSSGKLSLVFFHYPGPSYCSPQQRHLATLLACQLLKTHRCVARVELHINYFKSHRQILLDALRGSPSITSVKLTFYGWIKVEDFATTALSLPHLQELEYTCATQHSATLVTGVSTFFHTTPPLTALQLSKECPKGLGSGKFYRALVQNCSLKELVLDSNIIAEAPPSAQAAFTEWLTNSVSLKSFTVVADWKVCVPLKGILGALVENRSIVAVEFRCPEVDQVDVQLLSKIFEQNKVLRSFKISNVSWIVRGHPSKDYDWCLKALIENHTLEEVALPIGVWDEHKWKELFEALPAKRNFKQVSIEALDMAPPPFVGKLCAALTETGADEKVSFDACITEEEFDERCTCKAFRNVAVLARDSNRAAVCGIFQRMPSLGHITSLFLEIGIAYELGGVPASALTTFLGATRTLKNLTLSTSWDVALYNCQEALMAGLAVNTSLKELEIDVRGTSSDFSAFSEPLADAVSASKNISRVHLRVGGPDHNCGERAFSQRLSAGIADNYTLLNVTLIGHRDSRFKRYCFKVWDVARRNCGLLTSAADFARGARRDRRCALALERMHDHPELVEEVARLEKVDQARAAAMVRDGLRSIEGEGMHAFMRLAGVVKESVSCNACTDGSTQLDALNEHCWRALRRYLKLYDIRDPTESASTVVETLS